MRDILTGIGIKIQGHLKIYEYKSHQDYLNRNPYQLLLNRRNAVHKDHASVMISKALTGKLIGNITYMVFGNDGTILGGDGSITFRSPNIADNDADLYNPIFFQMVDDTLGALSGNQMAIRHISNSQFTDVDIRCLIPANQPFGQLPTNREPGTNFNTSAFVFDEIGLKLIDGTLLTHVVFAPILKTASSILEIVYTLRFFVGNPEADGAAVTISLSGLQATTGIAGIQTFDGLLPPGSYYWETTLDDGGTGYVNWGIAFGVCNANMVLTDTVNADLNLPQANSEFANFMTVVTDGTGNGAPAWGYPLRPSGVGTHNAVADGQVYSVAVNTVTHLLWWRAATGADTRWNANALADPATGVGGIDISASGDSPVTGNLFAMVGATQGASLFVGPHDSPSMGTINFGDGLFAGGVPSGYVSPANAAGSGICTLNPLDNSTLSLSNGNLTFEGTMPTGPSNQGNPYSCVRSNFSIEQA